MPVTKCDTTLERFICLRDNTSLSWRTIATLSEFHRIPPGTLSAIYKTKKVPKKWYRRFNMPPETTIVVITGEVPAGSQAIAAQRCECGQHFISNHPRRRKCFICSAYRGK